MIVNCENIEVNYGNQWIFDGLNFSVKPGEKVVITGESGKGKTTLMNVLAGFTPITSGTVQLFGEELNSHTISKIRSKMAWVPQETSLQFDTVEEMVYSSFEFALNRENSPSQEKVKELFEEFGLSFSLMTKKTNAISGGQRQRILLISSLLLNKPLLLVDEPTSALDEGNREKITDLILSRKELTVVASSHDNYWISKSDKIIAL